MIWLWSFISGNYLFLGPAIAFVVLACITKDLKLILISVAVLLLVGYISSLRADVQSIRAELRESRDEVAKQSAALAERNALLDVQNKAVEGWKSAAVQNARLRQTAEVRAAHLATKASSVSVVAAPESNSHCSDRDEWLRSQLNDLLWPAQ